MPTGDCQVPPKGWRCTRGAGHDGPCAALPTVVERMFSHRLIFEVTHAGAERAKEWSRKHDLTHLHRDGEPLDPVAAELAEAGIRYRYTGAIGGAYTWEFTPTGLGTVTKVRCSCGEELDLTDYDSW